MILPTLVPLAGTGSLISILVYLPIVVIGTAMEVLFLLFLLRTLLRSERLAIIALTLAFGMTGFAADGPWLAVPAILLVTASFLFVLVRLGLLALVVSYFVFLSFFTFPMTLSPSSWFFAIGFTSLSAVLAMTAYGFKMSIGNRHLLDFVDAEN
jgi:hypothetical protein